MKNTESFKGNEISFEVLREHQDNIEENVNTLVRRYNRQLKKNGLYICDEDLTKLTQNLLNEVIIKLDISSIITEAKLKKWEIFPISENQSKLFNEGLPGQTEDNNLLGGQGNPDYQSRKAAYEASLTDEGPDEPEGPEEAEGPISEPGKRGKKKEKKLQPVFIEKKQDEGIEAML